MWRWLPKEGTQRISLLHERTGHVIASSVQLALTRRTRRVGLLGHRHLDPTVALVLAPCFTIHTAFMRFPIDVLFMSREGYAVRVVHALKPWRATASIGAYAVVELAAGTLARHSVIAGDRLLLEPSVPRQAVQRIA